MRNVFKMKSPWRQQGLTSLEFAIVGLATCIILFMAIEMGRLMFTANFLAEASRRAARMAVICLADTSGPEAYVRQAAVFNYAGGNNSPFLRTLNTTNISVDYLAQDGSPAANPADNVFFVQARITNLQFAPFIPGIDAFTMPEFATTLPAESMGYAREDQTSTCNSGT